MKISELPQEVKKKALHYQRTNFKNSKEKFYPFDEKSDDLNTAFNWEMTKEGGAYWVDWNMKNVTEIEKPIQYQIGIDTFERSESNLTKEEIIAICKFNIDKYCWRKKDQDKEDFKKIIDYANWAIKIYRL